MKTKKILILTADAGFGHRSAANALAAAFDEKYGSDCEVKICNLLDDKRTPFFLRDSQTDYDRLVRNTPKLYQFSYEASDTAIPSAIAESALIVMLYEVIRDVVKEFQPDAIISTYTLYQTPVTAFLNVQQMNIPYYMVVTDFATVHRMWFNKNVDGCIVPTNAVRDLALANGITEERIFEDGIPVHPSFAHSVERKEVLRYKLGWEPDVTTLLAVGSSRVLSLAQTLKVINHSGHPIQLAIVAGKSRELYKELMATDWHLPVQIYEYTSEMYTFMQASDAIITKAGGLIVTESLAAGLPMMLINVIPGQETGNAEYVTSNGAGDLAEEPIEALEVLSHWMINDKALLKERTQNAIRLGKPASALVIAERVWNAVDQTTLTVEKQWRTNRKRLVTLLTQNHVSLEDIKEDTKE